MATTITKTETLVGKRIRRREDPRLITGTATYVEDIKMPGMHHACHRAQPACGGENPLDRHQASARSRPASSRVFTGKDTENVGPVPCGASLPGLRVPHHHILATDRVYFVGHPVAVVVATDRYLARDAADLVEVDYDVLPAVADPEKALAPGAPAVHPRMARQYGLQLPPGRRRGRQGFRRGRSGGQAAHHQPAPDPNCDGNARRGGRLARGAIAR